MFGLFKKEEDEKMNLKDTLLQKSMKEKIKNYNLDIELEMAKGSSSITWRFPNHIVDELKNYYESEGFKVEICKLINCNESYFNVDWN